jgi:hypothetical protein
MRQGRRDVSPAEAVPEALAQERGGGGGGGGRGGPGRVEDVSLGAPTSD